MAKHKPHIAKRLRLIWRIKIFIAIVALTGSLTVVFRAHCLSKWLLFIAVFAAAIPASFVLSVYTGALLHKKFPNKKWVDKLISLTALAYHIIFIVLLFGANNLYCYTLLNSKCTTVSGVITKWEVRYLKHDSWTVFIYNYQRNGTLYEDNIPAYGTTYKVGDTIPVKVSDIDATVNEVIQESGRALRNARCGKFLPII
ncbi:MAG: hypothetical protein RLZZ367_1820 [Bacteroidota bacterium]|jgi:hypothetical protein